MNGEQNPGGNETATAPKPGETITPGAVQPAAESQPQTQPEAEVMAPRSVAVPPTGPDGSITWTASEFVAHNKAANWYILLGIGAVAAAAIIWFLTKDTISTVVVIIAAILFGIYGARKPRELQYVLDDHGLSIGPKHYPLEQFRSFSIVPEGAFDSIVFSPLRRFSPLTTIYYDPADEPKIIDLLSNWLPHEERERDLIDRLMWRIRF